MENQNAVPIFVERKMIGQLNIFSVSNFMESWLDILNKADVFVPICFTFQ